MFQMATLPQFNCNWAAGVAEMLIVSIGTGRAREPDPHPNPMGASILKLAARAPGALMRGASQEIDITCRTAGHCLYGHSIDRELGTMMDGPSDGKRFSYVRYDADISTEGQIAHGAPVPYRPLKMDDVHMIKHFDLLGQSAGQSEVNLHTQLGDFL